MLNLTFSNQPKSDLNPIGSDDPLKYIQAADWQEVISAFATIQTQANALALAAPMTGADGIDGALHFDGTTTILGMAPVSNVYTLTRVVSPSSLVVDAGVFVQFDNWYMPCLGDANINGTIGNFGRSAVGYLKGTGCSTGWFGVTTEGGANGGAFGSGGNASGDSSACAPWWTVQSAPALGANGAGNGQGGSGGTGSGPNGGAAGAIDTLDTTHGRYGLARALQISSYGNPPSLGTGGGSGGAGGAGYGGGGGAPGGLALFSCRNLTGTGIISCAGGNGGDATGSGAADGGGGGGGGILFVVYASRAGSSVAFSVAGGLGGAGIGGAGPGGNGSPGTLIAYNVSGDGS